MRSATGAQQADWSPTCAARGAALVFEVSANGARLFEFSASGADVHCVQCCSLRCFVLIRTHGGLPLECAERRGSQRDEHSMSLYAHLYMYGMLEYKDNVPTPLISVHYHLAAPEIETVPT